VSAEATAVPVPRTDTLAIAAAGVTVALWASAFVGIRAAGDDFSPGGLALGRLTVAAVVLGLLVLARREPFPAARDLPLIALSGLLWLGAYSVLLNAAEQRVDAGTAAMLVNVGPILIALLAGYLLGEGYPRTLFAGSAIAFAGVIVIAGPTSDGGGTGGLGVALCLLAAIGYAGGVVTQKVALRRVSSLQTIFLSCVFAAIGCAWAAPSLARGVEDASGSNITWVVYLGPLPHCDRLRHLGVRARPDERRPAGRDHLSRSRDLDTARLGLPRRDAAQARVRRRRRLRGRRGGCPPPAAAQSVT
jgi:drug/metabolite transporter (DMT)-like permease